MKIVGIGDSTTAGAPAFRSPLESPPGGAGEARSQYSYWMMKEHPEWEVLNRGIAGERTDQILARFARDAISPEPEFVVILGGVNDIFQGVPVGAIEISLSKMYQWALDSGMVPVACSVLPYSGMSSGEKTAMETLYRWILDESKTLAIPFCDTALSASDPKDRWSLADTPDGAHPGVEGYHRMARAISLVIAEDLKEAAGAKD